jgi:hypothetical protein
MNAVLLRSLKYGYRTMLLKCQVYEMPNVTSVSEEPAASIFISLENGVSRFLGNFGDVLPDYSASCPRKLIFTIN